MLLTLGLYVTQNYFKRDFSDCLVILQILYPIRFRKDIYRNISYNQLDIEPRKLLVLLDAERAYIQHQAVLLTEWQNLTFLMFFY